MKFTHKPFLTTLFHVMGFVLRENHFFGCFRGPKVEMSMSAKSSKNRIFRLILVRQQTETIQLFVPNNLNEKKIVSKKIRYPCASRLCALAPMFFFSVQVGVTFVTFRYIRARIPVTSLYLDNYRPQDRSFLTSPSTDRNQPPHKVSKKQLFPKSQKMTLKF